MIIKLSLLGEIIKVLKLMTDELESTRTPGLEAAQSYPCLG